MAHDTHKLPDNWEPGTDSDLNVSMIVFVSLIGVILLVVIIFFLRALYFSTVAEEVAGKLAQTRFAAISDLQATQHSQLQGYEWVDAQAGLVSIPIDRAMELVVSERSGQGDAALTKRSQAAIPGDFVYTLSPGDEPAQVVQTAQQEIRSSPVLEGHGDPPGTEGVTDADAETLEDSDQQPEDSESLPDEATQLPEGDSEVV